MRVQLSTLLLLSACALSGCATGPNPRDPYERLNRKVYAFNERVDKAILKPVAKGYVAVVPKLARRGVTNFFNNIGMFVTTLNDAAQFKGEKVPVDIARFATNTVFGMGGLIDVASALKIEYRSEDFGQSMGYWGVGSGPYLVLPLLGPSTIRDGSGLVVDYLTSPFVWYDGDDEVAWGAYALNVVNTRANLLDAEKFFDTAAVDRYAFLRDTFQQRREYLIHDGNPPAPKTDGPRPKTLRELEEEEFGDEPVSPAKQ